MKRKYSIIAILLTLIASACNKELKEDPQSVLTPLFFSTSQGFQAGLDAVYAGNRDLWGPQALFTLTCMGTDEFKTAVDGNNDISKYNSNYLPTADFVRSVWNNCYKYINTCNGLINNAPNLNDIDAKAKERMVAEAKFLRANYYFVLVQFWGDVTLNTEFQSTPTTSATRTPKADVYRLIIQDLKDAAAVLPASPLVNGLLPGKANAAAASHLLAKVYMARAGSSDAEADDYQNAYNVATALIANSASIGLKLQQDFESVYREGNEQNSEVLWTVQHTSNTTYNGSNDICFFFVSKYDTKVPGMQRNVADGRPYARAMPTRWLTDTVFKDKVTDTRYSKTFQTVWYCNNPNNIPKWPNPVPAGVDPSLAGKPKFAVGDTACFMPGFDVSDAKIASTRYLLIPPRKYTTSLYPSMKKYADSKRPDMNATSVRPFIVWTFSETYLIAAEAAFRLGNLTEAVKYINVIRERAAYPSDNAAAMDISASDLSLDFILDERSRELCGQLIRAWDLARTGQMQTRIPKHNPDVSGNFVVPKHLLRPVPQTQIDAVSTGDPYPQNPGW